MAAAIKEQYVSLARTLHPRLTRFFAKYPPLIPRFPATSSTEDAPPIPSIPDTTNMNVAKKSKALNAALPYHNPFMPRLNHETKRWIGPQYGLRIQADLCKLARAHGVEELMPFTIKRSDIREQRRLERGNRVKGTGKGEKVKGHKWERHLAPKLEKRRQAMMEMPAMIEEWKLVSFIA